MELTVNDNTYYTKLSITSQDKQFSPILARVDSDVQLIITTNNQPIELVISAYMA